MSTYTVTAKRWEHGWELHIDDVGVTQSHSLRDAPAMAREYIAMMLEVPMTEIDVDITPDVGPELNREAAEARTAIRAAEETQRMAAESSRVVVRKLKDAGLSGADVAAYLRISPQRVEYRVPPPRRRR